MSIIAEGPDPAWKAITPETSKGISWNQCSVMQHVLTGKQSVENLLQGGLMALSHGGACL